MGLFNALFGKRVSTPQNVDLQPDLVWFSEEAKFCGLTTYLNECAESGCLAVVLLGHFADCHQRLKQIVNEYAQSTPAIAVRVDELSSQIATSFQAKQTDTLHLIVGERHPLYSEDERVLTAFANELPCRCRVRYFSSLDDPLIELFAGATIKGLLQQMGFDENSPIESSMVQRRILQAQKKIEKAASGNRPADSAQEWMKLNLPTQ